MFLKNGPALKGSCNVTNDVDLLAIIESVNAIIEMRNDAYSGTCCGSIRLVLMLLCLLQCRRRDLCCCSKLQQPFS